MSMGIEFKFLLCTTNAPRSIVLLVGTARNNSKVVKRLQNLVLNVCFRNATCKCWRWNR